MAAAEGEDTPLLTLQHREVDCATAVFPSSHLGVDPAFLRLSATSRWSAIVQ